MQYNNIFIIVLLMKICMFYIRSFVIFLTEKNNGIFTLKNEILKNADFASELQKSRFRGLEI